MQQRHLNFTKERGFHELFLEYLQDPAIAALQIGGETYTSADTLATRARHSVLLRALNQTKYKFTALPSALKEYTAQTGNTFSEKPCH